MIPSVVPVIGMFNDHLQSQQAVEELQHCGLTNQQLELLEKDYNHNPLHYVRGLPFSVQTHDINEQELQKLGITDDEAHYYADEYQAGHPILLIYPATEKQRQQASQVLDEHAAHHSLEQMMISHHIHEDSGAITPGMRPEDSSQNSVAMNASGQPASQCDDSTIEADIEHARRMLHELPLD